MSGGARTTNVGRHRAQDEVLTDLQSWLIWRRMVCMPLLTESLIPPGRLAHAEQPQILVDDELTLRPWIDQDAAVLTAVYQDPETQRWHARTVARSKRRTTS